MSSAAAELGVAADRPWEQSDPGVRVVRDAENGAGAPCLPAGLWAARPELQHVHDAARSLMVSPDAALGATMALACARTDYRIVLPAVVGRVGSLNMTVGLVGRPGSGKGAASDAASRLLSPAAPSAGFQSVPAGSGEGMVHAFFERVMEQDGKRKVTTLRRRYWSLLVRVDEGQFLNSLRQRAGQSTMETIRSAWSGEALGGSYASSDRQARLGAHDYRLVLVMAIQPETGKFILEDSAVGTPQRFLWFGTLDPTAPPPREKPEWPGPLEWEPPQWEADRGFVDYAGGHRRRFVDVDPGVVAEIQLRRHEALAGRSVGDEPGHDALSRLKVAAVLGILNGRVSITSEDWYLASLVMETSAAVRDSMGAQIRAVDEQREKATSRRMVARQLAVRGAEDDVLRAARTVANHVANHVKKRPDPGEPCKQRCVTQAIHSELRHHKSAALSHALAQGWIVEVDGGFEAGDSRPR